LDQISKDSNGNIKAEDSKTYDKWSQALASLYGILNVLSIDNVPDNQRNLVFLPVVVVPDNKLWQINYSREGQKIDAPKQVNSISYWVDVTYDIQLSLLLEPYNGSLRVMLCFSA
jgi:hypothetical protein